MAGGMRRVEARIVHLPQQSLSLPKAYPHEDDDATLVAKAFGADNLLVVNDDIALPLGTIRLRKKGADGGHNGLTDIIEKLGTNAFCRLRFGIGDDFPQGRQIDFVLGQWKPSEEPIVDETVDKAVEAIKSFVVQGPDRTMNAFNKKQEERSQE